MVRHLIVSFFAVFFAVTLVPWREGFAEKPLIIQASKYPQHFQVSIKWNQKIPYQVEQHNDEFLIVFDRDRDFKQLGFENIPKFIKTIETQNIDGSFVTKLKIAETSEIKYGWVNGNFRIDVINRPLKKPLVPIKAKKDEKPPTDKKKSEEKKKKSSLKLLTKVNVKAKIIEDVPEIRFMWTKPVKAAAVHWGGHLILVFDHPALFELSSILRSKSRLVRRLAHLDTFPNHGVFILPLPALYAPSFERDKNTWILKISQIGSHLTKTDLQFIPREKAPQNKDKITFAANDLGQPITLEDPESGLPLSMIPSDRLIASEESYPQFRILPALMGVAILHKSTGLEVSRSEKGFDLKSKTSFYVSGEEDTLRMRNLGQPTPLLRFPDSTKKELTTKSDKESFHHIELKIRNAKDQEREKLRLDLVNKLFLRGLVREAMSQLNIAFSENPSLLQKPSWRAMKAIMALLDDNESVAKSEIESAPLSNEPETAFLKALYAGRMEDNHRVAISYLKNNINQFKTYPNLLRNKLLFMACESALRTQSHLDQYLNLIQLDLLTPSEKDLFDFYKAKSEQLKGNQGDIEALFIPLLKSKNLRVKVLANLNLIEMNQKTKVGTLKKDIQVLEKLRFMWAGDYIEYRIFHLLGDLYVRDKNYTNALRIYKEAYHGLTHIPESKGLYKKIVKLFVGHILEDLGASPLELVLFFREFKEFMPDDNRRILIQLKLVEAYIVLDLLENAIELLEQILKSDTDPEIKMSSRLLLVDLLERDGNYQKALDYLDKIEKKNKDNKNLEKIYKLKFKAFLGLNLYDKAQGHLEEYETQIDTTLQQLELAWKRKDWNFAQTILSALIRDKKDEDEEADPQLIMNYVVASFFNKDEEELEDLRELFYDEMKSTPMAEAFDLLTSKEKKLELTQLSLAEKLSDMSLFEAFLKKIKTPSKAKG